MEKLQNNDENLLNKPVPGFLDWRYFFSDLSIEGVRYIVKPGVRLPRKIFWSMLVALSFGFLLFQIQSRFSYYQSRPTRVDIKFIRNKTLRFPTVTICNSNFVNLTKTRKLGEYIKK